MADAINKAFVVKDLVLIEIGVYGGLFGLVHVFGELSAVRPEDGAASAAGPSKERRRAGAEKLDRSLGLHSSGVQDKGLGLYGVGLRETATS